MNNDTFAGNAAPAPTTTPQSTPVQSEAPTQSIPQKPKTGLIIGIIIAILAIIIGAIVLIIVIGNNNSNEGGKDGSSSASSKDSKEDNNKGIDNKNGEFTIGVDGKTILVENNAEKVVRGFIDAGYDIYFIDASDGFKKTQINNADLDTFFKTPAPTSKRLYFEGAKTGKMAIEIEGVVGYSVEQGDNMKIARSEFELDIISLSNDGFSFNSKPFEIKENNYDEIKKYFGREANEVYNSKNNDYFSYKYNNINGFTIDVIANGEKIKGFHISPTH
ncbi:MAG: hypothetical protein K5837_01345 [Candidatus Saccharibacteria bacterium]|nr:hypothetical protein [Candidatus Saccharibacteria bacterium]